MGPTFHLLHHWEHSWFIADFEILYDGPARKISSSSESDAEGFLNQAKGHV
ncbi:unnamed protein product [Penicillium roqueforti FM164]|uniref:Uncharacterized protein n=1 Tax=Penicillium roqueforti (strain FM164) TaxID=1365484 RepID=W6QKJ7_PENRF|nr:unnamed protein product [Penicillium roqueforti FM164]